MKNFLLTALLVFGVACLAPSAYARDGHHNGHHGHANKHGHHNGHGHHGHGVHHGHGGHHGHGHHNGHSHHGHGVHNGGGFRFDFQVGPSYRYPQYPRPYPRPYPAPAPTVRVLVTEVCYGRVVTHYVWARWDHYRGGYWFYDCHGFYRRAR